MTVPRTWFTPGILLLWCLCLPGTAEPQRQDGCRAPFQVGFRIVDIPGGPKTAIWYPTSAREQTYPYSKELSGSVAKDGPPLKCGRFPLIVFSHGLGGCGIQSVFFTEQLPRAGYVVMAPDHRDALCSVGGSAQLRIQRPEDSLLEPQKWTPSSYADRRADLEAVIDWALQSREFSAIIDREHIGGVGHSLGGYALLGLAGGWPSWKDPRIKALLLFSPYVNPFLVQNRLKSIDVPLMYQGAQFDIGITPFLKGAQGAYAARKQGNYYVELRGGNHFEWTNALCFGQKRVQDCLARKPNARLIVLYGASFLDSNLKGDNGGIRRLRGDGLATLDRGGN